MEELARLLLALFAVALLINLVKGGPSAVGRWLKVKFTGNS